MNSRKTLTKGNNDKSIDVWTDIALAAIISFKRRREVHDFMDFILGALERNAGWLNHVINRQHRFKCVFMTGSGPHRFQIQEVIYPAKGPNIRLKVEAKDTEDHDKVAVAALLRMPTVNVDGLMKFIKHKLDDIPLLKRDLLKGKSLKVTFAVLKPYCENQYRISEKIAVENTIKTDDVELKKRKAEYNSKIIQCLPYYTRRKSTQRSLIQRQHDLDAYLGHHAGYDYVLYM